jgi:hypothetical protein
MACSSFSPTAKVTVGIVDGSSPAARMPRANAIAESPTTLDRITSGLASAMRRTRTSTSTLPKARYASSTTSPPRPRTWSVAMAFTQRGQM